MRVTRRQLRKIITESVLDQTNLPVSVTSDSTFYWIARDAREVQPGFVVPVSGPIKHVLEIENIYEEVRLELNPTAPSRFNCVYICPSLNGFCRKPVGTRFGHLGGVYKVRVTGNVFFADAEMWTEGSFSYDRGDIEGARDYAVGYWEGLDPQEVRYPDSEYSFHEALVDGTVTVIERVY